MLHRRDLIQCWAVRHSGGGHEFLQLHRAAGRYMAGTWHPVSGKIEPRETAWAAAVRELREETGLIPESLYALDRIDSFYVQEKNEIWTVIPFCASVGPDQTVRLNEENDAHRWIERRHILSHILWPGDRQTAEWICTEILDNGPARQYLSIGGI